MEGRDGAIFAYGQTGSGKTYLMEGVLDAARSEWGIVPFVVEEVLARLAHAAREQPHRTYIANVSYLEARDLPFPLAPLLHPGCASKPPATTRQGTARH